jgi:hypothetical protein
MGPVGCAMTNPALLAQLRRFRGRVYEALGARRDALFGVLDAATCAGPVPSVVHLSLVTTMTHGWGSLYAALAVGGLDVTAVRGLLREEPLDDGQAIYALDTSVWPRPDAETSPERGYYYSASRQSAGQPIVAGWNYAWLAQVSFTHDSWTAPLDVRRVPLSSDAHAVAAAQIRDLVAHQATGGPVPLFVFDAGYDPEALSRELGDLDGRRVAILVRLRRDRCFYADPLPPERRGRGRPGRHGRKFACRDAATWWTPADEHVEDHAQYGQVRVRAWANVHVKPHNHPAKGANRTLPTVRGTLVLVEVERLPRQTQLPEQVWLWWRGPGQPALAVLWRAYVHRFDLEHTYRFVKQTLNWAKPRLRQPEQADRWTWLVALAYTQLRLARRAIADHHLPWEAAQRPQRCSLTPTRVRQGFLSLLLEVGTPAAGPKSWGRSPGRPRGARSAPAPRYPALKKTA